MDTPLGLLTITDFTPTVVNGVTTGGTFSYSYLLQDNSWRIRWPARRRGVRQLQVIVTDEDGSSDTRLPQCRGDRRHSNGNDDSIA